MTCQACRSLSAQVGFARGDLATLRRKFRATNHPEALAEQLEKANEWVVETETRYEAHAADEHDGTPDLGGPTGKVTGLQKDRSGKVPCALCGKRVGPLVRREHTSPAGFPCPGVARSATTDPVHLTEPPPVVIKDRGRPTTSTKPPRPPRGRSKSEPTRLDAGSSCRECGKWLPGERSLCGRCSVLQGRAS